MIILGLGLYVSVSSFFYYYPEILYKKQKKTNKFKVISHRGGSGECTENTLAAFKHSLKIGVDIIEFDCHLTKDGKVVISHDNNLIRTTGVNKNISDLNYEELPDLIEEPSQISFFNPISSIENNREIPRKNLDKSKLKIPLLEDVFKSFPNLQINLDIKMNNDELIQKVNDLIIKYNRESNTTWGSFREQVTRKCLKLNPNVESYFSLKGCLWLLFLMVSGLLPFVPIKENYLEIIMPNFLIKNNKKDLPWGIYFGLMLIKTFFVRKSFIKHLQKRGIRVYFWVLNSEIEFNYAINLGVDGIMTDYPTLLIEYLKKNVSN